MSELVRVSTRHKRLLGKLVKLEKENHDNSTRMPSQESVLNVLIEKEAKRKGIKDE